MCGRIPFLLIILIRCIILPVSAVVINLLSRLIIRKDSENGMLFDVFIISHFILFVTVYL